MGLTMSATPKFTVSKLDTRFAGHRHLKYRIKLLGDYTVRYDQYIQIRNWCWDTWGSSCERDILIELADKDESFIRRWSWHAEKYNKRFYDLYIYLATDQEYVMFKLKWM